MRVYKWLPALVLVFLLAGCNTMEGFGEDVGEAGEGIEEAGE